MKNFKLTQERFQQFEIKLGEYLFNYPAEVRTHKSSVFSGCGSQAGLRRNESSL